jgi:hypothetical protein
MLHVVNANFGRKRVELSDVGIAAYHPRHSAREWTGRYLCAQKKGYSMLYRR